MIVVTIILSVLCIVLLFSILISGLIFLYIVAKDLSKLYETIESFIKNFYKKGNFYGKR